MCGDILGIIMGLEEIELRPPVCLNDVLSTGEAAMFILGLIIMLLEPDLDRSCGARIGVAFLREPFGGAAAISGDEETDDGAVLLVRVTRFLAGVALSGGGAATTLAWIAIFLVA